MDTLYSDSKNTHTLTAGVNAVTVRTALQVIGTDIIRKHLHSDVFVDAVIDRIRNLAGTVTQTDYVVIPDLRFPNELTQVHASFPGQCTVIHVTRDARETDGILDEHVSENLQESLAETVIQLNVPSYHFHSDTFDNWDIMVSTILDSTGRCRVTSDTILDSPVSEQ